MNFVFASTCVGSIPNKAANRTTVSSEWHAWQNLDHSLMINYWKIKYTMCGEKWRPVSVGLLQQLRDPCLTGIWLLLGHRCFYGQWCSLGCQYSYHTEAINWNLLKTLIPHWVVLGSIFHELIYIYTHLYSLSNNCTFLERRLISVYEDKFRLY